MTSERLPQGGLVGHAIKSSIKVLTESVNFNTTILGVKKACLKDEQKIKLLIEGVEPPSREYQSHVLTN